MAGPGVKTKTEEKVKTDSKGRGLRLRGIYETIIDSWNPGRTMYLYFPRNAKPKDREKIVLLREGKYIRGWKFENYYFRGDRLILEDATRRVLTDTEMSLAHVIMRRRGM